MTAFTPSNLDIWRRQGRVIQETGGRYLSPCCGAIIVPASWHTQRYPTCRACGKEIPRQPPSGTSTPSQSAGSRMNPEPGPDGGTPVARAGGREKAGPTKTEQRYYDEVLAGRLAGGLYRRVVFHGLRLYMANGHIYTPDWCAVRKNGQIELHEVKGSYRLGSFQRSRLAFDQARVEWPEFLWIWAEKTYDGWANDWKP